MGIWENWARIFEFYEEIQGYEHLILDFRGNTGGNFDLFIEAFVLPNLTEAIYAPDTFVFFQDGPYVRRFGDKLFCLQLAAHT